MQVAERSTVEIFMEEHKMEAEGTSETSVIIYQPEPVITGKPVYHNPILASKRAPNFLNINVF
jgi:hypothetical protein